MGQTPLINTVKGVRHAQVAQRRTRRRKRILRVHPSRRKRRGKQALPYIINPRRWLALAFVAVLALFAAIWFAAPAQLPVAAYKLALVLVAGLAGHLFDCVVFPYAVPSSYLYEDWRAAPEEDREGDADFPVACGCERLFMAATFRKAAIVAVFVLGVCLGL